MFCSYLVNCPEFELIQLCYSQALSSCNWATISEGLSCPTLYPLLLEKFKDQTVVTWIINNKYSPGVVFLQLGNETRRALLPNEITTLDTVRALFVRSFPRLTMEHLDRTSTLLYIKDTETSLFYHLQDLKLV